MGLWRWRNLPAKMAKIAADLNLCIKPNTKSGPSISIVRGASSCVAGGYSIEAIFTPQRNRDFS